ncbi:NAD-dependent epimerase/dehydratase family protein [Halocella sp. SP3-1]|uniref:NAD-dependent epimerase/dehydratase family protein n=1 Tax=Halocella sp. SP3-1 TaxID=2382161 RepID=UPI000F74E768|nr:NAD-dependent epimerase/dehydratase family protein [Halocella sp. SP3-1]AZO94018.1 NAD-dependent epimerase/dehydratase family protein [Halocella sp. SP3-1]
MKKVLITGGAGFIGFHLAQYLSEFSLDVTLIDNFFRGENDKELLELNKKENVRFVKADLTNPEELALLNGYFDYIYHLAAINGTRNFYEKPFEVLRVNILTLINILNWINPNNCGKFLFTSSSETYAGTVNSFSEYKEFIPTKENIPLTINDVFNERNSYGGSKIAGELLTVNYCRTRQIPFSIIRYHNIYGPRMGFEHVIPEFSKRIYKRENPFKIFGGEDTRAFCYITDAVKATKLVMENNKCDSEIINIGNNREEIRIIDLAKKFLKLTRHNVAIDVEEAPKGSVSRRCPNIDKLEKLTTYKPEIDLDKGLQLTYDWYNSVFKARDI